MSNNRKLRVITCTATALTVASVLGACQDGESAAPQTTGEESSTAVTAGGSATASATTSAAPGEVTLVDDIVSPEGPLYFNGEVYFVSAGDSTFNRWDGSAVTVLNAEPNCAHNGVALTANNTFLLACSGLDNPGIIEVGVDGVEIRRWNGPEFAGGVNDIYVAKNGGVYATICGSFELPGEVVGRIIYRAPESDTWRTVADDLSYANGVGLSPDQKTLYVSELIGNNILKFTVQPDGSLSRRTNFVFLNTLIPNKHEAWQTGPDSMKIDSAGNIYVAQYAGGRILKISPNGELLQVIEVAAGDGTENLAFDEDGKNMYVAVVHDFADPDYIGAIVKVPVE